MKDDIAKKQNLNERLPSSCFNWSDKSIYVFLARQMPRRQGWLGFREFHSSPTPPCCCRISSQKRCNENSFLIRCNKITFVPKFFRFLWITHALMSRNFVVKIVALLLTFFGVEKQTPLNFPCLGCMPPLVFTHCICTKSKYEDFILSHHQVDQFLGNDVSWIFIHIIRFFYSFFLPGFPDFRANSIFQISPVTVGKIGHEGESLLLWWK